MRAISLWQPWATFVIRGIKSLETRTHARLGCLKGERILIHAAQKYDKAGAAEIWDKFQVGYLNSTAKDFPRGALLGSVFVADTGEIFLVPSSERQLEFQQRVSLLMDPIGRYGLWLEKPQEFHDPLPWRGHQGIFNVPDKAIEGRRLAE